MANRQTNQKEMIIDVLEEMNHPTAEELLAKIEKKYGSFSKATLYRNLAQFVEDGKVDKLALSDAVVRYEISKGFHYHLACEYCGRIDNLVLPKPLAFPSKLLGYDIDAHSLTFYGVCPKCKEKMEDEE
ncbi:MAG: transcriptional repressor [Clostridiales bacterium]|nr:transcriptional repressor [Candidatus Apopatousia equi]